jgi:UDP-N-acetylglucosamine 2-epimerase
MKFLSIIGTRPQYIKVIDNLSNHVIADTRQHYDEDMSDVFIKQLRLKPKYKMGAETLGDIYEKSCEIIKKENPDVVLVYGDTRSTLGGALAAKFCKKTLAHVESGMRSGDITQPEELNRIIVDRISDFKFCANDYARRNLVNEGLGGEVYVVGDPMWDNLKKVLPMPKSKDSGQYNLITIHREQTVENPESLKNIIGALEESKQRFIFPAHPRTRRALSKFKIKIPKNVELIKPQGYKEMIKLETNARKILTDSGGVTREAYWFLKPLIILRTETEWGEIVEDGWGVLVGCQKNIILYALENHHPNVAINKPKYWPSYGAKDRIKDILCQ